MDHTLNDSMNLDGDFESITVGPSEITLDGNVEQTIPLEFEPLESKSILMETTGSDLVGQTYTLTSEGEFTLQEPMETVIETTIPNTTISEGENQLMDLQFTSQTFIASPSSHKAPQFVAIKPAPMRPPTIYVPPPLQTMTPPAPRHVAIAPKPQGMPKTVQVVKGTQPFATTSKVKKVSLTNVMQAQKGQPSVLAQIGKQLVMIPAAAASGQKFKLMPTDKSKAIQAQIIQGKTQKPVMTKVIVQNQPTVDSINQPAVLTKLGAAGGVALQPPRFVTLQPKTVPISLGNKVIVAATSPTKNATLKPVQPVTISPQKKMIAKAQGNKKFIITMNTQDKIATLQKIQPNQPKVSTPDAANMHTEIHQINVPGKGIQYIKLVTNKNSTVHPTNVITKPKAPSAKTILLTDNKGNIIQMTDGSQLNPSPQQVVVTSGPNNKVIKTQKFVRIAPVNKSVSQATVSQAPLRPAQSLLTSQQTTEEEPSPELEVASEETEEVEVAGLESKDALRKLVEQIGEEQLMEDVQTQEVEISFERQSSVALDESTQSAEELSGTLVDDEHSLLVLASDAERRRARRAQRLEQMTANTMNAMEPLSPVADYAAPPELDLRPRKPCNCNKSQCLKLYCDCFANGEFCNNCNCFNCHNNLDHEDLRQKAIRGCLERNPNAFRPKIGKLKPGGGGPALEMAIRRHNKGCNCKRSGCLKNYCECFEAKIACSSMCKCFGCRNVEDGVGRRREPQRPPPPAAAAQPLGFKQPCSFMTSEVIEAVCQCLLAAAAEPEEPAEERDAVAAVVDEFARCLQDIVCAAHQGPPVLVESNT